MDKSEQLTNSSAVEYITFIHVYETWLVSTSLDASTLHQSINQGMFKA